MGDTLRIAASQFSVEGEIAANRAQILAQIAEAARREARLVHFSEAALSGYAGVDLESFAGFDWEALEQATRDICREAAEHRVWVILGSAHRLSSPNKPHNSLYVISDAGQIVDRYDKRFCTGLSEPTGTLDLAHYSPGNHQVLFDVDGIRCGVLICYDYRFPELYRGLKAAGVEVLLQSFHNARRDQETHEQRNIWKDIVPATMMGHAASNHIWISATNSAARYSSWGTFFVRPDGQLAGQLPLHEPGLLICDVDLGLEIWDAPGPWRERAIRGQLHSGTLVEDPRSSDRKSF